MRRYTMEDQQTQDAIAADEPLTLFGEWFAAARAAEPNDPEAVALATATADAVPSVRMVLMKGWGPEGFVFYTNLDSPKGAELRANAHAALCFYWKSLGRQVRVEGSTSLVSAAEADQRLRHRS